jgi:hypothetical protein
VRDLKSGKEINVDIENLPNEIKKILWIFIKSFYKKRF